MNNKANPLLKGISIFLVILAVITATISNLLIITVNKISDIEVYKQAFVDTQAYQRLPGLIAEKLTADLQSVSCQNDTEYCALIVANPLVSNFVSSTPEARKKLAEAVIKSEFLQRHFETALDGLFSSSSAQSGRIKLVLPLDGIKQLLQGEAGYQAVNDLIRALEPCTYKEMNDLGLDVPNQIHMRKLKVPYCHVPEYLFEISLVQKVIREAYDDLIAYIPSQYQFQMTIPEGGLGATLSQVFLVDKTGIPLNKPSMVILSIIPVLFLIIASILVVRDLKTLLKWWGIPLLITGALGILLTFGLHLLIDLVALPELFAATANNLDSDLQVLMGDLMRAIMNQITHPIFILSGILVAFGLIMLAYLVIIKKRKA
jgi:hypothetical protein